jgi:outer membrane protein assembly factor BamB
MRRIKSLLIGLAAAFAVAGPPHAGAADFAVTAQLNPAHTGSTGLGKPFAPPLARIWKTDLGAGQYPTGPILIAKRTVFVIVNGLSVVALDLATGAQKWTSPLDCCDSMGAYDRGTLFFVSGGGEMTALSAESGTKLWSTQLTGQTTFDGPPLAAGGRVFTVGAGSAGTLYAVDEKTGTLAWSRDVAADGGSPTIGDGGVYVAFPCNYYKFAPADGTPIWHYESGCIGGGGYIPALFKHRLYVPDPNEGGPYILDAQDGSVMGTFPSNGNVTIFTGQSSGKPQGLSMFNSVLTCWNARTGASEWTFSKANLWGTPIVVGGSVFTWSESGSLYALDEKTGQAVWSDDLGWAVNEVAAGENTLIATANSNVVAYRPGAP